LIVDDLARAAFLEDSAVVDDEGAVADAEGLGDVMVGDQDGFAKLFLQACDPLTACGSVTSSISGGRRCFA